MKNKLFVRTLFFLSFAVLILQGCKKDDPEKPTLSLDPSLTEVHFPALNTTPYEFEVITNQESWSYSITGEWFTVEKSTDTNGFILSAPDNNNPDAVEPATLTITAGNAQPITITVTQDGNTPSLTVTPDISKISFTAGAVQTYEFTVTTNQEEWAVDADEEWITIVRKTDNTGFFVNAILNTEFTARNASITITAGVAESKTIAAEQLGLEIYAMGHEYIAASTTAGADVVYWKNGEKHTLLTGGSFAPNKMFIQGDDIYVAARWAGAGASQAILIKNNTYIDITNKIGSTENSNATGVWVDENDVYVAYYHGPIYWKPGDQTTTTMALLLKNNETTELSNHLGFATTSAMWKEGSDLYILGNMDGDQGYWKNGVRTNISGVFEAGDSWGGLTGIMHANGKLFIAGYSTNMSSYEYEGFWWVDGTAHRFNVVEGNDMIYGLDIDNQDNVYLSGSTGPTGWGRKAMYVKNGEKTVLIPEDNMNSVASAVKVWGNDIYTVTSSFAAPGQSTSYIGRLYKNSELLYEFVGQPGTQGIWMDDLVLR